MIDMHTHAFSDSVAERAIAALNARLPAQNRTPFDGRLSTLCGQLELNGFSSAVLCQIATKPSQFEPILDWSKAIVSGKLGEKAARMIIPLPSVHPDDPEREKHLVQVAKSGFKGVKLHPYYQQFKLDDAKIVDYFKIVRDNGLFAITHAGYDIGFPFEEICGPRRVLNLLEAAPGLRLMLSHFGAWQDWENAARLLIGTPVDIEISMSVGFCDPELLRKMLNAHPAERLYFGSDWPWSRHSDILAFLEECNLTEDRRKALLAENARRFLSQ